MARQRASDADAAAADDAQVPDGASCDRCGGRSCVEMVTMNGGGTYAQEREVLQKEVCRACGFTRVI